MAKSQAAASQTGHGTDAGAQAQPLPGAILVPVHMIKRDPNQPRRDWRADDGYQRLNDLTKSIQEFGILQPLLVREEGDHYVVVAGGRRLVAAQRAGLTEIPVVVRNDSSTARVRVLQLIENLQRHSLTAGDEARAFQELIDIEGMTPPQIALRVRVSEQYVRDRLRILRDQVLSDAVERHQIAMSVAREINKLADSAADVLRKRVESGEKVTMADIHKMRRLLAAAGIVNPRLSPRADRPITIAMPAQLEAESTHPQSESVAAEAPAQQAGEEAVFVPQPEDVDLPDWLAPTTDRQSGRTVAKALKKIQQDYDRFRATAPAVPQSMFSPTVDTSSGRPARKPSDDQRESSDTLNSLLAPLDRRHLEGLLLFALEQGWTIPGLLQNIRMTEGSSQSASPTS